MRNKKVPQKVFLALLKECQRLGLAQDPVVLAALEELREGHIWPEELNDLRSMIASRQEEIGELGLAVAPPSSHVLLKEGIHVGRVISYDQRGDVSIDRKNPRPFVIIGSSGTGKTSLMILVILKTLGKCPIIVIDVRRDYDFLARMLGDRCLVLDAQRMPLNLFHPEPGVSIEENDTSVIRVFGESLMLFHRGQNVMLDAVRSLRSKDIFPTVRRILKYLERNKKAFSHNKNAYDSSIDRLKSLDEIYGDAWNVERGLQLSSLQEFDVTILRTGGLGLVTEKIHFMNQILMRLFLYRRAQPERRNEAALMLVLEEIAYGVSKSYEKNQWSISVMTEVIQQSRAVDLQLVLITQDPELMNSSVLNNCGNQFVFALRDGTSQRMMVKSLGLPDEAAIQLGSLPEQLCYHRPNRGDHRRPFLMQVDECNVDTTPLSVEEMSIHQARNAALLRFPLADPPDEISKTIETGREAGAAKLSSNDFQITRFLFSILAVGEQGVTAVYRHANVSPTTGKKHLQQARDLGLADTFELFLPGRSGRRSVAYLTKRGREAVGAPTPEGIGGDRHVAAQKACAFALRSAGLDIMVEKNIGGKSADLVHRIVGLDGKAIFNAIEFEFSTSGIENAEKDLAIFAETWLIFPLDRFAMLTLELEKRFSLEIGRHLFVVKFDEFLGSYLSHRKEILP